MRQLPKRTALSRCTLKRLAADTKLINAAADPKAEADKLYTNARKAKWFLPVVEALRKLSGLGERCMLCSGSECSDVEHFWPKSKHPARAMIWENYLWSCTPCNRGKSNEFPLADDGCAILINPFDQNPWDFFYIDEFGNLNANWDRSTDTLNFRASETIRVVSLDRQALQESRRSRMDDLKEKVSDTCALLADKKLTVSAAKLRIATWRKQPFQPDVADYFLSGPGKAEKPFSDLFKLL